MDCGTTSINFNSVFIMGAHKLGMSRWSGVVLLLFIPFQGLMGKSFSNVRRKTAQLTDNRIRVMNEINNRNASHQNVYLGKTIRTISSPGKESKLVNYYYLVSPLFNLN